MEKEHEKVMVRKCVYCGEEVKNPNINYCQKCGNVLWTKSFVERRLL